MIELLGKIWVLVLIAYLVTMVVTLGLLLRRTPPPTPSDRRRSEDDEASS